MTLGESAECTVWMDMILRESYIVYVWERESVYDENDDGGGSSGGVFVVAIIGITVLRMTHSAIWFQQLDAVWLYTCMCD